METSLEFPVRVLINRFRMDGDFKKQSKAVQELMKEISKQAVHSFFHLYQQGLERQKRLIKRRQTLTMEQVRVEHCFMSVALSLVHMANFMAQFKSKSQGLEFLKTWLGQNSVTVYLPTGEGSLLHKSHQVKFEIDYQEETPIILITDSRLCLKEVNIS